VVKFLLVHVHNIHLLQLLRCREWCDKI